MGKNKFIIGLKQLCLIFTNSRELTPELDNINHNITDLNVKNEVQKTKFFIKEIKEPFEKILN